MNVKKIAPLLVALVLGGIAAKMAFNFVSSRQSNADVKRPDARYRIARDRTRSKVNHVCHANTIARCASSRAYSFIPLAGTEPGRFVEAPWL